MTRYLTSPSTVLTWRDGTMVAENHQTHRSVAVNRDALILLGECSSARPIAELRESLLKVGYDVSPEDVADAVHVLVEATLLTEVASGGDSRPPGIDGSPTWNAWGPEAQYFHFSTKDAEYLEHGHDENPYVTDVLRGEQPAIFKRYPEARRLPLHRCPPAASKSFADILFGRRTVREFEPGAIPAELLSQVCEWTFAPQRLIDAGGLGILPLRSYANAGARSEFEVYVNADRVDGIEQGLYHYNCFDHCLEYLKPALVPQEMDRLTFGQGMCTDAPVAFFVTARVDRLGHKYRHPRALRALYFDAGHLGQTFAMVVTATGLGAAQTIAFRDSELEELLGVDGISETAVYWLTMGVPLQVPVKDVIREPSPQAYARSTLIEDFSAPA